MRPKASDFEKKFDEELLRLGKATSRGSYTPYQVRLEGVAEFVREWMTDRAAALATAPHFTEFFETQLKKEFPEIWKIMQQAQADIQQYTQQGAEGRVRSMIVSGGKKESGEKLSEWWNRTRIKWEHELLPLEQAMEELRELGLTATTEEDFYQLAVN